MSPNRDRRTRVTLGLAVHRAVHDQLPHSNFPRRLRSRPQRGLRLLRPAARTRAEHGRDAVGQLYAAIGVRALDTKSETSQDDAAYRGFVQPALAAAGLPAELADALDNETFDTDLRSETNEAFDLTGKDVGTPIIRFQPPGGVAFFGPVISRLPSEAGAVRLWDHVIGLAEFSPGCSWESCVLPICSHR